MAIPKNWTKVLGEIVHYSHHTMKAFLKSYQLELCPATTMTVHDSCNPNLPRNLENSVLHWSWGLKCWWQFCQEAWLTLTWGCGTDDSGKRETLEKPRNPRHKQNTRTQVLGYILHILCTFSVHSLHILCTFCTLSTNFRLLDLEPNWVESSETPHVTSFLGWKGKQSSEGEFQNHFLTGGVWSEFAPLCLLRAVSTRGVLDDLGWRKRQSFAMWIRWQISVMDLCDGSYLFRT